MTAMKTVILLICLLNGFMVFGVESLTTDINGTSSEQDRCHNYCLNGARCSLNSFGNAICFCAPGFEGMRCEIDPCRGFCLFNGQCTLDARGQPTCQCQDGTSGPRCQFHAQTKDSFAYGTTPTLELIATTAEGSQGTNTCSNQCLNGGTCKLNSFGEPLCTCSQWFHGPRCEEDLCHNYCLNNGQCSITEHTKEPSCNCPDGWSGSRCQAQTISEVEPKSISLHELVLYLVLVALGSTLVTLAFFRLYLHFCKKRIVDSKLLNVQIVRKNSPATFNGSGSTRIGANTKSGGEANPLKTALCRGPGRQDVIDLEDCCQMVLCDKPCNEIAAVFEKKGSPKKAHHASRQLLIDVEES